MAQTQGTRALNANWAHRSSHIKVPDRSSKLGFKNGIDPRKPTFARRPSQQGINGTSEALPNIADLSSARMKTIESQHLPRGTA